MKKNFIATFVIISSLLQGSSSSQTDYVPLQTFVSDPTIPVSPGGDFFGSFVYNTKDFIFVGAPHSANNNVLLAGSVYVFKKDAKNQWVQSQILSEEGIQNHEGGIRLKSYDKWLFVPAFGTPLQNTNLANVDLRGSLIIYRLNDKGLWQVHQVLDSTTVPALATLSPHDPAALIAPTPYTQENGAFFGLNFDVDPKNNHLLIAAEYQAQTSSNGSTLINAGAAYAFRLGKNNQWKYVQTITSPIGNFANETFGAAMAIHDKIALISNSPNVLDPRISQATNSGNGSVYVYKFHHGKWNYIERVQGTQTVATPAVFGNGTTWPVSDNFGSSLDLNGKWALIGASFETKNPGVAPFAGALYFFRIKNKHGQPHLKFKQKFYSDDPSSQGFPFIDVVLEGKAAYASDPMRTGPAGIYQGGIITYQNRKGIWQQEQTIYDPNGAPFSFFGTGLSANKKNVLGGTSPETSAIFSVLGVPRIPSHTTVPGKAVVYKIKN